MREFMTGCREGVFDRGGEREFLTQVGERHDSC